MIDKIVLWLFDNGHGGILNGKYQTKGKRSPKWPDGTQLFEGDFNRGVVRRMMKFCEVFDVKYYNIVPELTDPWNTTRVDRANNVLRRVMELGLNVFPIYVSIHGNAGHGTGWEVYTSPGKTLSDDVATVFFNQSESMFGNRFAMRKDDTDGDLDKEAYFTVITDTVMPAILTENFFFDQQEDCKFMMSDEGKAEIALMHGIAMLKWEKGDEAGRHWILKDERNVFRNDYRFLVEDPGDMPRTNLEELGGFEA